MLGSGSEEDVELLTRFYADDEERDQYREWFPQGMPQKQQPPFDRDRHLPQPPAEPPFADGDAVSDSDQP
jgi:hypothetical protein